MTAEHLPSSEIPNTTQSFALLCDEELNDICHHCSGSIPMGNTEHTAPVPLQELVHPLLNNTN